METKGISKLDLKRRNRKQILLAIRQAGMLARVDIAAQLSLTRAAVTIITNQMISQNILEDMNGPLPEEMNAPKKKGRKKTMIRINPTFKYVLGAAINEHDISVGLANLANEPIDHKYLEISDDTAPDEIISFIVSSCRDLMKKHSLSTKQMLGLGIGVIPARWEQLRGELKGPIITFEKLVYLLEMELSIPVLADSAINLYALANIDYTNPESANQLMLYSGQAYNSVAVVGQELLGGFLADSDSVSHMIVKIGGTPCEGYPDGSVYAEITRPALERKASALKGKPMTAADINEAFAAGDKEITELVNTYADQFCFLMYNTTTGHHVRRVVMHGFKFSEQIFNLICEKLDVLGSNRPIKLTYSRIDGENSFLAGSALTIERQFYEMGGMLPGETAN
ncbi:MAG: ROK family protein [Oscillospiraceae bacterium]|nr:ROK family protein [Oscillospiraceae bacterium]